MTVPFWRSAQTPGAEKRTYELLDEVDAERHWSRDRATYEKSREYRLAAEVRRLQSELSVAHQVFHAIEELASGEPDNE